MIRSKSDYVWYCECDRVALKRERRIAPGVFGSLLFTRDLVWSFQRHLRLYEYYLNCKHDVLSRVVRAFIYYRLQSLSIKLGFTIPANVFGPGLSIAHRGTIVVNANAKIGNNCRMHVCVNIGAVGRSNKAPVLGNNIYIGPGAKLFGDIHIGDNTIIGANAVVNKSFPNGNVVIAGVPAVVIGEANVDDHLILATDIVEKMK
jgi:serine O-acetyltransferase